MSLAINSFRADTHVHTGVRTETILSNQVCTGLRPLCLVKNFIQKKLMPSKIQVLYTVQILEIYCYCYDYKTSWYSINQVQHMWPDLPKGSYTCAVSRHTFHHHLLATSMDQQQTCLILLKVEQSAFTQASFSSLSGIHKCSGGLYMAPSSLDKQTADCESLHNWMMSLTMDLAALCDMWRWKWHQW